MFSKFYYSARLYRVIPVITLRNFLEELKKDLYSQHKCVENKSLAIAAFLPVEPGLRQYVDSTHEH